MFTRNLYVVEVPAPERARVSRNGKIAGVTDRIPTGAPSTERETGGLQMSNSTRTIASRQRAGDSIFGIRIHYQIKFHKNIDATLTKCQRDPAPQGITAWLLALCRGWFVQ